jgi:predicted dehydrogenase
MRRRERNPITRRKFLKRASGLAALTIVPRHVLGGEHGTAPSDRLAIACIGVGSQGTRVMIEYLKRPDIQVVAVCDVDRAGRGHEWGKGEMLGKVRGLLGDGYVERGFYKDGFLNGREQARALVEDHYRRKSPGPVACASYADHRKMLEEEKSVEGVLVATPDHSHAAVALAALRHGKHVHCQKPMAHTVREARLMADAARQSKAATQVFTGNQASESTRVLCEWIGGGVIGPVREVHNWSNRPVWPQGLERPKETPPVPADFDWDLWLGPAPARPYHPIYLPMVWRGWFDFGTGALGDMGCYSFDTIFRALRLGAPLSVEATSSPVFPESYPLASVVRYRFPARGEMPPISLTWYDGGLRPETPEELEGKPLEKEGLLFIGDKGKILCEFHGQSPRLLPESKMRDFQPPPKTLPRSIGHDEEWIRAARGGPPAGANFTVAGPITEALLLGNVALRTGKKLAWNPLSLEVPGVPEAAALIDPPRREGWSL